MPDGEAMNAEIIHVPAIIGPVSTSVENAEVTPLKVRGRPFTAGNPGRPKGSKNRATIAAEKFLEGEALTLSEKARDVAMSGDMFAMKLCLDRAVPVRKSPRVTLPEMPKIRDATSALEASDKADAAFFNGEIDAEQHTAVMRSIEAKMRLLGLIMEDRLTAVEEALKRMHSPTDAGADHPFSALDNPPNSLKTPLSSSKTPHHGPLPSHTPA